MVSGKDARWTLVTPDISFSIRLRISTLLGPFDTALSIGVEFGANRHRSDTLPRLLIAQDVSRFHNIIQHLESIDEAKDKKPIIEAEAQAPQQLIQLPRKNCRCLDQPVVQDFFRR